MTSTHRCTHHGSQNGETSVQPPPACAAAPSFTSNSYNPGKSCYKAQSLQTLLIAWPWGCLCLIWKSISFPSGLEYSLTIPVFTGGKQGRQLPLPYLPYINGLQPFYPQKQKRHRAESLTAANWQGEAGNNSLI